MIAIFPTDIRARIEEQHQKLHLKNCYHLSEISSIKQKKKKKTTSAVEQVYGVKMGRKRTLHN